MIPLWDLAKSNSITSSNINHVSTFSSFSKLLATSKTLRWSAGVVMAVWFSKELYVTSFSSISKDKESSLALTFSSFPGFVSLTSSVRTVLMLVGLSPIKRASTWVWDNWYYYGDGKVQNTNMEIQHYQTQALVRDRVDKEKKKPPQTWKKNQISNANLRLHFVVVNILAVSVNEKSDEFPTKIDHDCSLDINWVQNSIIMCF